MCNIFKEHLSHAGHFFRNICFMPDIFQEHLFHAGHFFKKLLTCRTFHDRIKNRGKISHVSPSAFLNICSKSEYTYCYYYSTFRLACQEKGMFFLWKIQN